MKIAIFILGVILASNSLAHVCGDYAAPSGARIEVSSGDGVEFRFKVPATLEGKELAALSMALYEKNGDGSFSTNLPFESDGKYAKGSYLLSWKNLDGGVYARYGNKECGPRLFLEINT